MIPVGRPLRDRDAAKAVGFFPAVGLVLGTVLAAWELLARNIIPLQPRTAVTVILAAAIPGGIHLDGLMDTADAFFSGRERSRSLEIMKDSRVGAMGVAAAFFSLSLKQALIASVPAETRPLALLLMPVLGRWSMCLAIHSFPAARPNEGLGRAFARNTSFGDLALACALSAGVAAALSIASGPRFIASMIAVTAIAQRCALALSRRLGGLTGDAYGALNELAEVASLVPFAILVASS